MRASGGSVGGENFDAEDRCAHRTGEPMDALAQIVVGFMVRSDHKRFVPGNGFMRFFFVFL